MLRLFKLAKSEVLKRRTDGGNSMQLNILQKLESYGGIAVLTISNITKIYALEKTGYNFLNNRRLVSLFVCLFVCWILQKSNIFPSL
jgi:hypothetical protein